MPSNLCRAAVIASLAAGIGACASTSADPFAALKAERGIFASPYVAPEVSKGPVGPEPEGALRFRRPWLEGLHYPGRGRVALDRNGNLVRLSRADANILRQRQEAVRRHVERQQHQQPGGAGPVTPPPPLTPPPVPTPAPATPALEP